MLYYHSAKPSVESKLIQLVMGLLGVKRATEKKITNNTYSKTPASIPKPMLKRLSIDIMEVDGRKVWTLSPKNTENNYLILFLHGGAYYANITTMHWLLVKKIIASTNATVIVPDYPLAPESDCKKNYQFIDTVYARIISQYSSKTIVFMGDSAGAGLALGYAQKIKSEEIKQPEQIIMFSPWLDVSMVNTEIAKYDKLDKILSVNGLKIAGNSYAGKIDVTDYRVSPIYGNFANLGRISVFTGTNDILNADTRKIKQVLKDQNINFNYFEYPKMFHNWVIVTHLKETKDVLHKIKELFKQK